MIQSQPDNRQKTSRPDSMEPASTTMPLPNTQPTGGSGSMPAPGDPDDHPPGT